MEADRRPFEAIGISLSSVETGQDRYTRNGVSKPPHSNWRCNLTALSQRYNLYFMASKEDILVFEPDFPFQKLGRTPKLLVPPALAEPKALGFLDTLGNSPGPHPHAINHLIVGDLGSEEILLASTDSGNIVAYHTKAILDASQKDPYKFSPDGRADLVGLRPFLSHWVYESAWGLAIHKAARMIAVSANTPTFIQSPDSSAKITVFAFALTSPTSQVDGSDSDEPMLSEEEQTDWLEWEPDSHKPKLPPRDRNYKIVLAGEEGHTANIPSISFVNTREDLEGSWLLSCDIHGDLKCWQIWNRTCYRTWDFAETSGPWRRRRQRQTDGGWMVAALDHASFWPASTTEAFLGHSNVPPYYGYLGKGKSYNITNAVRLRTPGRSQRHPLNADVSDEDENEIPDTEEIGQPWCESDSDLKVEEDEDPAVAGRRSSSKQRHMETLQRMSQGQLSETGGSYQMQSSSRPPDHPTLASEPESTDSDSDDVDDHQPLDQVTGEESEGGSGDDSGSYVDSIPSPNYLSDQTQRTSMEVESGPLPLTITPELSGDDGDRSRSSTAFRPKRSLQSNSGPVDSRPEQIPAIPALHLSQSHLRLINLAKSSSPHFFCANLLRQDLPDLYNNMQNNSLQRLNMLHQIPELGIVVIGSQLGRVAVCSLTCTMAEPTPGIRVDWILPTRRQERSGIRPKNYELLGIAVSPIQGRQSTSPDPHEGDEDDDEDDDDSPIGSWAHDCKAGGVETTFDDLVVVLSNVDCHDTDSGSSGDKLRRQRGQQRPTKKPRQRQNEPRKRSSWAKTTTRTKYRRWPDKPQQGEDWEAIEGTTRYRLMMTYADMTVLTYEIGRGIERDEIAVTKQQS